MAEIINISSINPITFEFQEYSTSDTSLITFLETQSSFNPQTDTVEFFVYDLNNQIVYENVSNFYGYNLDSDNNVLTLDPGADLINYGFTEGQYNTVYNFLSPKLASNSFSTYYISEISSDRTEVRLDTTSIPNTLVISSATELINNIANSTGSYYDFYLDFGNNDLVIANNALLDTTDPNNPTVFIKLYEPLPQQFTLNSQCWSVIQIANTVAYNVDISFIFDVEENNITLAGPNYNLDALDKINNSTAYINYNTLKQTSGSYSQGTGSLQYQLNSLLVQPGISINVDYSDYSNFIHFSNAQVRLENFYYKISQLEQYNYSASFSNNSSSGSYYVSSSNTIWQAKINEVITTFDDYEYFLYFDSGSACWPKTNSNPPYVNATTSSIAAQTWLNSQLIVAEDYDLQNNNALTLAIPSYITEDSNNNQFILFVEMIGQLFDNIFVYLQNVTTKFDADNRLTYGVSKDLVADILRDLGITIYQNNFSSNDLYQALLGLTPSGSLYNLPYTTTQFPVPSGSGLEYITNYVTASLTSSLYPTDDINKEQYKRIYHNLPLLLKKKGSVAGLRDLITTFGIPDTILRINEFGGKDRNLNSYDNWQDEFNYAFYSSGSSYISSSFVLNTLWNASANRPQAVEFRFKTDGLPFNTSSIASQSLWETNENVKLTLKYTGSGYTTSSLISSSADPVNPYYQFAKLDLIPDPLTPSNSASVYLPFYDGGWWSILVNKITGSYTLYAKNKNYDGEDGNIIGWQASSSVTTAVTNWSDSIKSYFGISSSLSGKKFSGSFQEIRYYPEFLPETNFNAYVMNPYSIENSDYLAFRAALGGELYTASVSIHPRITGSWTTIPSFVGTSNFYLSGSYVWEPNTEVFYFDQVPAGIQNAISDKIKQQNIVLPYSSSDSNIPNANVLSPFISVQQFPAISSSYTRDIDYIEIAFSPQNEINEDINSTLGYFNIGEVIGDPRFQSSSAETYPALDAIREAYFAKYTSNYQEFDYIRLIEFFDNSLFKMIQDFTPARASLAAGIVIKNTLIDRNRYPVPQVSPSSSIAFIGSGSNSIGIPYVVEDLTITGSIESGFITGSNGGSMPELFGQTASFLEYPGVVNITQSWIGSSPSLYGPVSFTQDSQTEFFNGQLSGSGLVVDNYGKLNDCNVELVNIYSISPLSSIGDYISLYTTYIPYLFNFDNTYYLSFTITKTTGAVSSPCYLYDNLGRILYTSPSLSVGNSVTVNNLEINQVFPKLYFSVGVTPFIEEEFEITNFIVLESYIDQDCLVVAGDVQVNRPSNRYMIADFNSDYVIATNEQSILSGSATRASVPDSNYTTARIANPRYNGCENTSPDINVLSGSKLPAVEQLTSYFAYSLGGGNTLAERSGSGNYPIAYLVDEVGNVIKPDPSSSAYLPSLLDAFGSGTTVVLSPTNNTTLAQSEFTIYKPAVVSNMILYSDTGSLGNDYLVSGSYASLNFNIVPGLYTQPYALNVEDTGQNINSGITSTASFGTINQDQAGGFSTTTDVYTVQNNSPVRAAFSASFEIENLGGGSTNVQVKLLENNTQIAQQTKTLTFGVTDSFLVTSSLFLNSGSQYYVTIRTTAENVDVSANSWTIVPITSSVVVNKPYFTTGSVVSSVLTSSAALGILYGSYQQTPITGSGFDAPVALSFQPYDEIRFGGNENLVSTIVSSSFNQSTGLFYLYLQSPINTTSVNIQYFAIRRWVPSINNLIINSPSNVMGAGLILPKYPSPLLNKNLPTIIENLTNKGLI
jgi:hypothetical protein